MDTEPALPAPRWRRWKDCLLGQEERRRRNTAMTALAASMMLCCTLVVRLLAAEGNGMDLQLVHWWATLAPLGLLGALVAVRSGWSERFANPSLSQFQLLWALGFNAGAYVITGPVRALALALLVMTMMFGIFSRTRREVLVLMVYALAAYTAAIGFTGLRSSTSDLSPALLTAHLVIALTSILTCTLMCLQVQSIRSYLRRQKDELRQALQQIQFMAMRDELTGLVNRRQMNELLVLELHRCQRSGRALLLAQLDIDHFKAINDTYGHAVGDQALQAFADTAGAHLRSSDVLSRWGGRRICAAAVRHPARCRRRPAGTRALRRGGAHAAARRRPGAHDGVHRLDPAPARRAAAGHAAARRPGAVRRQARRAQPRGACRGPAPGRARAAARGSAGTGTGTGTGSRAAPEPCHHA